MKKIEHIGIAVSDLNQANELYSKILGVNPYKTENIETESVVTSFFRCGNTKIELLQSTSEDGAIAKFIQKRGEGMHHIAFQVEGIKAEILRLKNLGFKIIL